jgi:putative endonuclease
MEEVVGSIPTRSTSLRLLRRLLLGKPANAKAVAPKL